MKEMKAVHHFRVDYTVFIRHCYAPQSQYNESMIFEAVDEADAQEQFTEYTYHAMRERARERLQVGSQIIRVSTNRVTFLPSQDSCRELVAH